MVIQTTAKKADKRNGDLGAVRHHSLRENVVQAQETAAVSVMLAFPGFTEDVTSLQRIYMVPKKITIF